jgi:hypothetical protein
MEAQNALDLSGGKPGLKLVKKLVLIAFWLFSKKKKRIFINLGGTRCHCK